MINPRCKMTLAWKFWHHFGHHFDVYFQCCFNINLVGKSWTNNFCKLRYFSITAMKIYDLSINVLYYGRVWYARKRINNACEVQIKNLSCQINVRNHPACLVMPNSYTCEGNLNLHLTTITILIGFNKKAVLCTKKDPPILYMKEIQNSYSIKWKVILPRTIKYIIN